MKWLRRLLGIPGHDRPPQPTPEAHQGTEAVRQALDNLGTARARWPEVHAVTTSLRELRERNHFAEQIQHIFEGGHRP